MMRNSLLVLFFFLPLALLSQKKLLVVAPDAPVIAGTVFQVQYVLENAEDNDMISTPVFQHFKLVTGPDVYTGTAYEAGKEISTKNFVFTLLAEKKGQWMLPAGIVNGTVKSRTALVVVADNTVQRAIPVLLAGEDAEKKIRQHIFLKAEANKTTCMVGEPVVVTFKLYSKITALSEVMNNPGFYGFSVYDMLNVKDEIRGTEKIGNAIYDVHLVRKVQLYPLQPGDFTIDAMEVNNRVNFIDDPSSTTSSAAHVYEAAVRSEPFDIHVKPLPQKTVADTFRGAVGDFTLSALLEKDSLLRNEEGHFTVTISGRGNFQQVSMPEIVWPKGTEVFAPQVSDSLDKSFVPLKGLKKIRYVFSADSSGQYTIPALQFTFFDAATRSYKTITSAPVSFFVKTGTRLKKDIVPDKPKANGAFPWILLTGIMVFILAVGVIASQAVSRKKKKEDAGEQLKKEQEAKDNFVNELLQPAAVLLSNNDPAFYRTLVQQVWRFFDHHFQLTGTQHNKQELKWRLQQKNADEESIDKLLQVLAHSEQEMYTGINNGKDKQQDFEHVKKLLEAFDSKLRQ